MKDTNRVNHFALITIAVFVVAVYVGWRFLASPGGVFGDARVVSVTSTPVNESVGVAVATAVSTLTPTAEPTNTPVVMLARDVCRLERVTVSVPDFVQFVPVELLVFDGLVALPSCDQYFYRVGGQVWRGVLTSLPIPLGAGATVVEVWRPW